MHISSKFEEDRPYARRVIATFICSYPCFEKRRFLAEHLCFRILGPLHVAIITRSGQRSRKPPLFSRVFRQLFSELYIALVYRKPTDNMPDYSSTIIGGKMSE